MKNNETKIEIRSRLIISSKQRELSPEQLKNINTSLKMYLNKTIIFTDSVGEKFHLTFNVSALNDYDSGAVLPSDNFIELGQEGRDFASPRGIKVANYDPTLDQASVIIQVGNTATISDQAIHPYSNIISHETLHLLGLMDRYHNIKLASGGSLSLEDDGFDRDIMSSGRESFHSLHVQAFVELVKAARTRGENQFFLTDVTNLNMGHISEKPMLHRLTTEP